MQTVYIRGYMVQIFAIYNGQELHITKDGNKVYGCRMAKNDSALNRAHTVIEGATKAPSKPAKVLPFNYQTIAEDSASYRLAA